MKICIVELDARQYTMTSHLLMPKMGPLEVGTYLARHGHDVTVHVECMNDFPEAEMDRYDVVGFSVGVGNANRVYETAERLRRTTRARLVAGGPHATVLPDEPLDHGFDYVVRGEGEETARELMATLEAGGDVAAVRGLSWRGNDGNVHNPARPFMAEFDTIPDYSLLKGFRRKSLFEQVRMGKIYENFVQTTRGCPFPCEFCYENKIGGTGYRRRSIAAVVEDIRYKIDWLKCPVFYITDANFGLDVKYTKQLLQAIIDAGIRARFTALVRIEIARDEEMLDLLRRAGFEMLCTGIESLDDETLTDVAKMQTFRQIEENIRKIRSFGLNVFGLFIGGFENDTEAGIARIADFALKNSMIGLNIMALGEYPGQSTVVPNHRYFNRNWDYFPGHYYTFFTPKIRPSRLQRAVSREMLRFYSRTNCARTLLRSGWNDFRLMFGGRYVYRHVWRAAQAYIPYLEEVERGHYDEHDRFLSDERLKAEYERSAPPPRQRVVSTVRGLGFDTPVSAFQ